MSKKHVKSDINTTKKGPDTILLVTMVVSFIVFMSGLKFKILNFDDNEYFRNYPEILSLSFQNILKYFSNFYVLMYQPIPILSIAIGHAISEFDPIIQHAMNVGLHLFNIYLVYRFIGYINPNPGVKRTVAFLFALHPLAVEPVMWISCRSSMFYVAFFLLGLISYTKYKNNSLNKHLWFTYLWFTLSLLSKAQAVTFPLALICLELFIYKVPFNYNSYKKFLPFLGLSLVFGLLAVSDADTAENIAYTLANYSLFDYLFILSYEAFWYVFKILVPIGLSPIYVYPVKVNGLLPIIYYISILFLPALGYAIYKLRKRMPYLLFGVLFFYLTLSVTLQILPSRLFVVADRYGYLPNIGIFYILACLFAEWKSGEIKFLSSFTGKTLIGYILGFVLIVLSFLQKDIWEDDITLSTRIIEQNPETPYIGRAYGIRASYKKNITRDPNGAIIDFKKAAELDSTDLVSRYNLADIFKAFGDTATAIYYFRAAHKASPISPMPLTDLGILLTNRNQFAKALELADSALEVVKFFPNAMVLKAVCELNLGNASLAENTLSECILKNPGYTEAYRNRGVVRLNDLNNKSGACEDFQKAADLGDASSVEILRAYCN